MDGRIQSGAVNSIENGAIPFSACFFLSPHQTIHTGSKKSPHQKREPDVEQLQEVKHKYRWDRAMDWNISDGIRFAISESALFQTLTSRATTWTNERGVAFYARLQQALPYELCLHCLLTLCTKYGSWSFLRNMKGDRKEVCIRSSSRLWVKLIES